MALNYLSGDDIGRKKSSSKSSNTKKTQRQTKRAQQTAARREQRSAARRAKTPAEKKAGRKRVFKKVAKVAVAPARAAFLTVVSLNALRLANKLVRVWTQPNGKETLTKFWQSFGGDINKLKKAIIKGSKTQINADEIGSATAVTAAIATATPIIVALVPIIRNFKAAGSNEEAEEFNKGVETGKKELAQNSNVKKSSASMPKNKDAGVIVDKDGEAQEDEEETKKGRAESETGGNDEETDEEKKKLTNKSKEAKLKLAEKKLSSIYSPVGFYFMILMYVNLYQINNIIIQLIALYSFIALLIMPFAFINTPFKKVVYIIVFKPFLLIQKITQWQKIRLTKI
jgi:hypothetical protein